MILGESYDDLEETVQKAARCKYFQQEHPRLLDTFREEGLEGLPKTHKSQLIYRPEEFVPCENRPKIAAVFISTGTTNKPKIFHYTQNDLDLFAKEGAEALSYHIRPQDRVISILQYGPHPSGTFMQSMIRELRVTHLPVSLFTIDILPPLIEKLERFNVLVTGAPLAIKLAEKLREKGVDPKTAGIEKIICGGSYLSAQQRKMLETEFGARLHQAYGMGEGAGAYLECLKFPNTYHIQSSLSIAEIDLLSSQDTRGEFLITSIHKEGTQFIRYQTGDLVSLCTERCDCGKTAPRIKLIGRTDDVIDLGWMKIAWTNELEDAFSEILGADYLIELHEDGGKDHLRVKMTRKAEQEQLIEMIRTKDTELASRIKDGMIVLEMKEKEAADAAFKHRHFVDLRKRTGNNIN